MGTSRMVNGGRESWLTSISPLAGQAPYTLSTGSIQTAGHSQSLGEAIRKWVQRKNKGAHPLGSFALTSTLPYWMLYDFLVLIRPLCTGGMTSFRLESEVAEHADDVEFVQAWKQCRVS